MMNETIPKNPPAALRGSGWKSLDQLAEMWGMEVSRARLVVGALLDSGRMEKQSVPSFGPFFRLVV